jgi:hypothetical protein
MINDKEFYGAEFSDNPATTKRNDSVIPLLVEWLFSLCELDLVGAGRFEHRHSDSLAVRVASHANFCAHAILGCPRPDANRMAGCSFSFSDSDMLER